MSALPDLGDVVAVHADCAAAVLDAHDLTGVFGFFALLPLNFVPVGVM